MVWAYTDCIFLTVPTLYAFLQSMRMTNRESIEEERRGETERERACLDGIKTIEKITTGGNEEDTVRTGI